MYKIIHKKIEETYFKTKEARKRSRERSKAKKMEMRGIIEWRQKMYLYSPELKDDERLGGANEVVMLQCEGAKER